MATSLQSALTSLQQNDYTTLIAITAVGYDYILTFSNEIEYIWNKPWTWVSMLFILVRYCSLFNLIVLSLASYLALQRYYILPPMPTTDVHTKEYTHRLVSRLTLSFRWPLYSQFQGEILMIINLWTLLLFFSAADIAMILRVWAMYSRSRLILGVLLALFSLQIIATLLAVSIYSNPRNELAATFQIFNLSFCAVQATPVIWTQIATSLQITQGGAMCILAIIQFVRQSLQMYRATKLLQFNRYMSLLARQGILYFFVIFLFALLDVLGITGRLPTGGWQLVVLFLLEYLPMYTLTPRFIISIRKLYAHDARGRCVGGIDTGFGLSLDDHDIGGETAIMFADVEQNEVLEGVEEIPMEIGTNQAE